LVTDVKKAIEARMARRHVVAGLLLGGLACVHLTFLGSSSIQAAGIADDFVAQLNGPHRQQFLAWRAARHAYDAHLDGYWKSVEDKRADRRKKKAAHVPLVASDYVPSLPPVYEGPQLPPDLLKRWTAFVEAEDAKLPPPPVKEIPGLDDYLATARSVYGFTPERVSERAFKDRYAEEALTLGLTKTQVVRVYALETGGQGTADMQSGVNPITKRGRPISSAIGYAQLLDANSVSELAKYGGRFIERLEGMAKRSDVPRERAAQLRSKAAVLARMWADAKTVPPVWAQHQAYAKTPQGQGIHTINLDGDIGPMLQAIKLLGLKEEAAKAGKPKLSGAEMELMNLAGPGTGLEILLHPAAANAPTTNFFSRRAYGVNKMVHKLTGAGLLAELDRRMDVDINRPGSVEFAAAFDAVTAAPLPWR
jgi:hypothetical protein